MIVSLPSLAYEYYTVPVDGHGPSGFGACIFEGKRGVISSLDEAQREVERIVSGVDGSMGVAAWPVGDREQSIGVNSDMLYPTASVFKIPILYSLVRMMDRGEIDLDERVRIDESMLVPGSGVLQHLQPGLEPTIRDIATLMTIVSDNLATDILHARVGVDRLHADLDEFGLSRIRVPLPCKALLYGLVGMDPDNPEHTYDMFKEKAKRQEYDKSTVVWSDEEGSGNDLTPPDQMAQLCEIIEHGVGLSENARDVAVDILKRQTLNARIPAGVPDGVDIAHKTGSLRGVRNDAGIVYAERPYVISIFSKHLSDENAGVQAMIEISRAVWNAFGDEPST